ncbi:MAG: hypothetical protein ABW199_02890 [Caulobacterales bacterium]
MVGDRGQSFVELLILAGLVLGSIGLYMRDWMAAAAPWGFAIPFVFAAGSVLLELRRQGALRAGADQEAVAKRYDLLVMVWSIGCAAAGAATFIFALLAEPAPPPKENIWQPPESAVMFDLNEPSR